MDEDARDLLCFRVIEAARSRLDKIYDVDHPPAMYANLAPRRAANGIKYDSGISPEAVEDPADRADYIKRREENAAVVAKHHQQVSIRQIWNSYTQFLEFRKKTDRKTLSF